MLLFLPSFHQLSFGTLITLCLKCPSRMIIKLDKQSGIKKGTALIFEENQVQSIVGNRVKILQFLTLFLKCSSGLFIKLDRQGDLWDCKWNNFDIRGTVRHN